MQKIQEADTLFLHNCTSLIRNNDNELLKKFNEKIGGLNKWYLSIDLQVECWMGYHQTMVLLLGIPQLIVYIIGLPVAGFVVMYHSTQKKHVNNLKVKYRESFRPFAPSVLRDDLSEWFNINEDSPYMLMVSGINKNKKIEMSDEQKKLFGIEKLNIKRSEIPAVTHVDYSARIQTVHEETNPKYFKLLKKFKDITQCPVLVNTSFNVRGEPIVNTPEDAYNCFMGTELDSLVIGNCYLDKKNQNKNFKNNYSDKFQLD